VKEALFYEKTDGKVKCRLCPHECLIAKGKRGICGVRENRNGTLYSLVYGKLIAEHVAPIEKKPVFHYKPGTLSYSIATIGCNFRCEFCQNWDISQYSKGSNELPGGDTTAEEVVKECIRAECSGVSYTYTEPTIFYEFMWDVAKLAKENGLGNVMVTNGFINPEPLKNFKELDVFRVDLKSFKDDFYRKVCGARLEPVLESMKLAKKSGIWVEVVTLIVPKQNDSAEELKQIAGFIKNELGEETPWHVSRFHPDYKMTDSVPTPMEKIREAYRIGKDVGLRYVYAGNVPHDKWENTYCYNCNELLIERQGFGVAENNIKNGKCPNCSAKIDIIE